MNDLNEQYKIELKLQEKKSNVRTLKSFLWFFIAMVVIWLLTAVDFFVIDTRWVTIAFSISAAFFVIPLILKGLPLYSAILYGWMNRRCRVYRVGGDEFLMVLDNPEASETENMIAGIRRQMSETRTDNGFVISSAVGYSEGSGKDICEVVKQADESMYKDKARCKRNGDDMSRRDEG